MPGFANTFGPPKQVDYTTPAGLNQVLASRGVTSTGFGNLTHGGPTTPTTNTKALADAPNPFAAFQGGPITATQPSTSTSNPGPAPTFRTVYNGQVYTDPNALAKAQASQAFQPIQYNGQTYTDPSQYANAVITEAQSQHDQSIKQINNAHSNGLITFDQQQKLIDQSRKSAQDQLSGYFNSISPDAVQSQQKVMESDTNKQYDEQNQQLGTNKSDFETNFANSIQSADKAFQGTKDQAANSVTSSKAGVQGILDAGQNAATEFQNKLASYNASASNAAAPKTTQFDPTALAQNFAGYLSNAQQIGIPLDQAKVSLQNQIKNQGFNPEQTDSILGYVYGQLSNPSTQLGSAYANKTPLAAYSLGQ